MAATANGQRTLEKVVTNALKSINSPKTKSARPAMAAAVAAQVRTRFWPGPNQPFEGGEGESSITLKG